MDKARTIQCGIHIYRPLMDETLTADDLRVACQELSETPENRKAALRLFKEMLEEQQDFAARMDDAYLLRFLRCRKFDLDRAFKCIRDHYMFRKLHPEIYVLPSSIEMALRLCIYNFLPHRDHKGRAVYVVKLRRWKVDKISFSDFVAAGNLVAEHVLDNPVTQINGYVGVWDMKGYSLKMFLQFISPNNLCTLSTLMQDRFPARFKIAYCVNCPALTHTAWSIICPILKEKFRKRIMIMGSDMKHLHKHIDRAVLPEEYGGYLQIPEDREIAQKIIDNEQQVCYNNKFGFQ